MARGLDDAGVGGDPSGEALDVRLEVVDGTTRLQLSGPFTARTAGSVRAALDLVSVARAPVVVDLVGVTGLDDAAEALLASARRAARREGWELVVAGAGLPPAPVALTAPPQALDRAPVPRAQPPAGGDASRTMVTKRTSKPARS